MGGIHKPGGSAILAMDITNAIGDPTGNIVADGTFRGHGLAWTYVVQAGANKGLLWCATAAAGASTTGDWTLVKLHPDLQWAGGDVTWQGAHEFDASVDISGNVAMDGDLTVDGKLTVDNSVDFSDVFVAGDITIAGKLIIDSSADFSDVYVEGDVSVKGVLKVDGTATQFGGSVGTGLFYDPTSGGFTDTTESVTFPNGLIMKAGETGAGATPLDISFNTAFPSKVMSFLATINSSGGAHTASINNVATTGFNINHNSGGTNVIYWTAVGY